MSYGKITTEVDSLTKRQRIVLHDTFGKPVLHIMHPRDGYFIQQMRDMVATGPDDPIEYVRAALEALDAARNVVSQHEADINEFPDGPMGQLHGAIAALDSEHLR